MASSPYAWLWAELARRLGPDVADEVRAGYLAEVRRYTRVKSGSKLAPDAPPLETGRRRHGQPKRNGAVPLPREIDQDWLTPDVLDRFWAKVRRGTGCWEWTGDTDGGGYGIFTLQRKHYKAHRVAWVAHSGDIPDDLLVCHHCDNPKCVRPDHLFLGTNRDNSDDKIRKGRHVGTRARATGN